jgi:hypothetical protein
MLIYGQTMDKQVCYYIDYLFHAAKVHFIPLVVRVEKRLYGIADFLNYGGKLQMANSVLASLPISYMSCFDVLVNIKEQVIKFMRHCLWRKKTTDVQAKGSALVAWSKICRPKEQGGLGGLN